MGIDGHHGIVGGASAECCRARVEDALDRGAGGGFQASVLLAIRRRVSELEVFCLAGIVFVMSNEEIPGHGGVFSRLGIVGGDGVVVVGTLVIASLNQKNTAPSERKTSSQNATTSAAADDDVLIGRRAPFQSQL